VKGMRFRGDDQLLAMTTVKDDDYLLVATSGGYGKRTPISEYNPQGRGGMGVMTFKYTPKRGKLIGALAVEEDDQIFAITSAGGVIRTEVNQIRPSSRATMGVRLVDLAEGNELLAIDVNVEDEGEQEATAVAKGEKTLDQGAEPVNVNSVETDEVGDDHDYDESKGSESNTDGKE